MNCLCLRFLQYNTNYLNNALSEYYGLSQYVHN